MKMSSMSSFNDAIIMFVSLMMPMGAASAADLTDRQQLGLLKSCPTNVNAMSNFSIQSFQGNWYEYSKYLALFETQQKCAMYSFAVSSDKSITLGYSAKINAQYNIISGFSVWGGVSANQTATLTSTGGQMTVNLKIIPGFPAQKVNYWILGTDYKSYAVVWSCTPLFGLANVQFAWVLTRQRNPSQDTIDAALKVFDNNSLTRPTILADQANC